MAQIAVDQDDILQSILHGNLTSVPNPPSRVVKVFISSTKSDFEQERRVLQDSVLPDLQRHCLSLGLDVQFVDTQQGNEIEASLEPFVFDRQRREIEECYQTSLGCFFLCLIGNKYKPYVLPTSFEASEYQIIYNAAQESGLDVSFLDNWFRLNNNLVPPAYVLQPVKHKYRKFSLRRPDDLNRPQCEAEVLEWTEELEKMIRIVQYGARVAYDEGLINQEQDEKHKRYFFSGVHTQLRHALSLSKPNENRIICVVRQFDEVPVIEGTTPMSASDFVDTVAVDDESNSGFQQLFEDIILGVDRKNVHYFSIPFQENGGIDSDCEEHSSYLEKFSQLVLNNLKLLSEEAAAASAPSWGEFPPPLRLALQEVVRESQTHLCNCRQHLRVLGVSQSLDSDCGPLLQIQELMCVGDESRVRHTPIIVTGKEGCGKSTLLSQVLMYCPEWLGNDVVRVVRHVGQSPCSMYTPELLRNLCLHISLVFGFEITPKHYSFELGKLSNWFQDLLKMVESTSSELVIILDNLHQLRSTANTQTAILGWLPWNLPLNVHILCSIAEEAETVLALLKSRISSSDNLVRIPPMNHTAAVSMLQCNLRDHKHVLTREQWDVVRNRIENSSSEVSPLYVKLLSHRARKWLSSTCLTEDDVVTDLERLVNLSLDELEARYGSRTIRKLASYLTCTNFGLREAEIVELLSSTDFEGPVSDILGEDKRPEFSLSCWFGIKEEMRVMMKEYLVDGRTYSHWSHASISAVVQKRYLSQEADTLACHTDLASAFHQSFLSEKDEKGTPVVENGSPAVTRAGSSWRKGDWSDMLREIDELWFHLMMSGDHLKLKQDAICNFDFLLSAIRGASISYIRSVLELVRCKLLDWEVELLYSMTKLSVDVLSQDPQQMATEILNWLRPFSECSSAVLDSLVSQALQWCNNRSTSLLVPQNSWLNLTLPAQINVMVCPQEITHMVATPDSQYVLCSSSDKTIYAYNLPSRNLVRTYKGHKANITCLHITTSGRWLVSGSEDTDVIIWDVATANVKHRLSHHITGVLCLTTTVSESLVLSGSEIGVAIVSRLDTGQVVQKLESHRGVISCIAVNSGDDIFATGSTDKTVLIWSLEDFSLLNSICLPSPICHMNISGDSTFLLLTCEDNSVHVRSLTTGSDVHSLEGHTGTVTVTAFARDNCRCVVGCSDGKCYVYDIHSAKKIQVLSGHTEGVVSAQAQEQDGFLITAGGNKVVVWSFYRQRKPRSHQKHKHRRLEDHKEPVTAIAVSRDGSLAISGSKDGCVKLWQISTGEMTTSLEGHSGAITCLTFAPNGLFAVSGSEDTTLRVWGLTIGLVVSCFKEHQHKITAVAISSDSRRILSVDCQGLHRLWLADTGAQISIATKATNQVILHSHWVFAVGGKNEASLKFWHLMDAENEKSVSHSDAILCYTVTYDCHTIITGSQDMSLKVWELATGKLTQVLVGHEGPVTCVAVAPFSPAMVVSGSMDCNLIVWDMISGSENFTLRGHTEVVKCVKLTLDGSIVVSGSDDNTMQLWNSQTGHRIAILDLHLSLLNVSTSMNVGYLVVHLANNQQVPIMRLHNNPGKGLNLDLPPVTPVTEEAKTPGHSWRGVVPKRVLLRGNLKREQSFDSFYWDLRSASPKHDMGASLDDFKRAPSPFGSREHLHLAGTIWDGNVGRGLLRGGAHGDKPKLPKHKTLKKQHSMFACFPEFTQLQNSPPLNPILPPPPTILLSPQPQKDGVEKKAEVLFRTSQSGTGIAECARGIPTSISGNPSLMSPGAGSPISGDSKIGGSGGSSLAGQRSNGSNAPNDTFVNRQSIVCTIV